MKKLFIVFTILSAIPSLAQKPVSGGHLKPLQAIMDIRHYTITLNVDPVQKSIRGNTEISLLLNQKTDTLLFDLQHLLKVEKVWVNNKLLPFYQENDYLYITSKKSFDNGHQTIKVLYSGKPQVAKHPPWDGGFTWATDSLENPWIAITDEGEGAKILFPCKDHPSDEPNEGADLIITVPKGLSVAGPGLLVNQTISKHTTTFHWKTNYSINNYCILFNVGKYDVVTRNYTTIEGHQVPIQFYVLSYHVDKASHHLDILEKSLHVQEKYFGEYPFTKEKIGICETPHLGMEHQTMNAYGNHFKYQTVGGEDFDWLMHHELGHEWWGNKVTAKDWAHYWIQEGICSFGDALYVYEAEGEDAYLKRMREISYGIQNKLPIILGDEVIEEDAYQPDLYSKGAFFMHTLRYVLGDPLFFPTLKGFISNPLYTYHNQVTTDDLEKYFSAAAHQDLKPLFDFYLRTTSKLAIEIHETNDQKYVARFLNYEGVLPLDIQTDTGITRMMIDAKGVSFTSKIMPIADPKGFYLKTVLYD
ncbi:MAG: M1 family metallopeptidase [Bacteroidetes bacterium]|nr:M1 family metallopeptidase [Bacteroidota bacterium]